MLQRQHIPNQLTLLRLVLAALFFLALGGFRYGAQSPLWVLPLATVLFILAAVTDALDGHLARKWQVESTFGRIMDPFCDKVLIMGALIYLAGSRFVDPGVLHDPTLFGNILPGNMISGIYPWMVVLIFARELLVTGIRGELESQGIKFGANLFGKLKMILQSVLVPVILAIVWLDPNRDGLGWLAWVRDGLVYATVVVSVISGLPYLTSAAAALRKPR